jgi:hypothetical protein
LSVIQIPALIKFQFDISEEKKKERQVLLALKQSGNELRQVQRQFYDMTLDYRTFSCSVIITSGLNFSN